MAEQGIAKGTGIKRGLKYSFNSNRIVDKPEPVGATQSMANIIPLSPESIEIQKAVLTPQLKRQPVVYNREFLHSYQPDVTSYLTVKEKQRLGEIGITARIYEPAGTYAKEIMQRLLIDLAWNSSLLEGNNYSLLDTQRLISDGVSADNIAIGIMKVKALELPKEDQSKFVDAVETELLNLHDGNFARYQIRPSEFKKWQEAWNEKYSA